MRFLVYGIVQGVGFRPTVYTLARAMGLRGYVRNNGSNVEICVDRQGEEFIRNLKEALPLLSTIERIESSGTPGSIVDPTNYSDHPEFVIVPSTSGMRSSSIPVDTALCDPCISELLTSADRRYHYPFTNCTDCGARYSIICDLPYDRELTTMVPFPLCPSCSSEYMDPGNRRFHAQTISCPECGPQYTLYDDQRNPIHTDDPFKTFSRFLESGKCTVLKSWGGMHILASLDAIPQLRERYNRKTKPFALMFRNSDAVRKYTHVTGVEERLLTSSARPILLLRKRKGFSFLGDAAPGLDSVGVMLPYTAAHHILFRHLSVDGIVATSANLPGEAMITTNDEVFSLKMDLYLLHNREIVQRVDDSLMKVYHPSSATDQPPSFISESYSHSQSIPLSDSHSQSPSESYSHSSSSPQSASRPPAPPTDRAPSFTPTHHHQTSAPAPLFIRKSRGFVPTFLGLGFHYPIIAVGPERNVTGAVVANSRLFLTQYIGNTRNYSNLLFLEHALNHLLNLTGAGDPRIVVRDMHPAYATNRVARQFSETYDAEMIQIQHHHAHAASLLLDTEITEMVTLTLDGTGYGPDQTIWGGEVLWTNGPEYQRIGTLESMPMPGGDLTVRDPRRMVFSLGEITGHPQSFFSETEEKILRTAMKTSSTTTSMGRILDSLSCILGGCCQRNYDGEPAMRLEPLLERGRFAADLFDTVSIRRVAGTGEFERDGASVVNQLELYSQLFEIVQGRTVTGQEAADLAHTLVRRIMDGYVDIACDYAEKKELRHIGLSGGVAYSLPIIRMFEEGVRKREMVPVIHERLPPGDGGISAGQVYAAGMKADVHR